MMGNSGIYSSKLQGSNHMIITIKRALSLVYLSALSLFAVAGDIQDIDAETFRSADKQGWLVLDVRSAEEYQQGHVPGAVNIAHTDLADNLSKIEAFKDRPVVVYCRSGYRASIAAKILIEHDFLEVKHLQGDMKGWQAAGYEIEQ